jgi:DNA-binding Xre family transcriptional regulator
MWLALTPQRIYIMAIETRFMELLRAKFPDRKDEDLPTITALSEEIGVQPRTISSWMKSRIERTHFEVLDKFCDYFDCEVCDLVVRVREDQDT